MGGLQLPLKSLKCGACPFRWGCTFLGFLQTAVSKTDTLSANPSWKAGKRSPEHEPEEQPRGEPNNKGEAQGAQHAAKGAQQQGEVQGQSEGLKQQEGDAQQRQQKGSQAEQRSDQKQKKALAKFVPETGCFLLTTDRVRWGCLRCCCLRAASCPSKVVGAMQAASSWQQRDAGQRASLHVVQPVELELCLMPLHAAWHR